MNHGPISFSLILVLCGVAVGAAQDEAGARLETVTEDVAQNSPLEALNWMVGTWVDEGEDSTIITDCSWTKNRKFLKRSFKVKIDEEVTLEGDQFVGWDPIAGQIRSWTFDSEGGIGEGRLDPGRQPLAREGVVRSCRWCPCFGVERLHTRR